MSFFIYFFVLLVSAASVLFGLDLVTSPLPQTPNVPIGRSVHVVAKPAAPKAKQDAQAQAQMQAQNAKANERALTPIYPTSPGGLPKGQAETSGSAPQEQATLEPPADNDHVTAVQRADDRTMVAARSEPAPAQAAEPKAQPAVQLASNSCNVPACSSAYRSFRASDCSYQPFEGERRLCTAGAATAAAEPRKPQQIARKPAGGDELRDVERIVRRQPLQLQPPARRLGGKPEMSEIERVVRQMTRDEAADIPVQDADGRVFIIRKSDR